jgi:hypothetical protein
VVFYKFKFEQLISLGAHTTVRFRNWHTETAVYLLYKNKEFGFINLSLTSFNLSTAIRVIKFFATRRANFIFLFKEGTNRFIVHERLSDFWKRNSYVVGKWVSGLLTNYKHVIKNVQKNPSLVSIKGYPRFVVALGDLRSLRAAALESRLTKTISTGLTDINFGPAPFTYSIFSNSTSFLTSFSFYKIFRFAIIDGFAAYSLYFSKRILKRFNFYYGRRVTRMVYHRKLRNYLIFLHYFLIKFDARPKLDSMIWKWRNGFTFFVKKVMYRRFRRWRLLQSSRFRINNKFSIELRKKLRKKKIARRYSKRRRFNKNNRSRKFFGSKMKKYKYSFSSFSKKYDKKGKDNRRQYKKNSKFSTRDSGNVNSFSFTGNYKGRKSFQKFNIDENFKRPLLDAQNKVFKKIKRYNFTTTIKSGKKNNNN